MTKTIFGRHFKPGVLRAESQILDGFLSDDLTEACEAAAKSGVAVFISTAALSLDVRKNALRHWRAKRVEELLVEDSEAKEAFAQFPEERRQQLLAGEVSFQIIDSTVADVLAQRRKEKQERVDRAKSSFWSAVRGVVRDVGPREESHGNQVFPHFFLIRGDGEISAWKYRGNCKQYGEDSGLGYIMIEATMGQRSFKVTEPGSIEILDSGSAESGLEEEAGGAVHDAAPPASPVDGAAVAVAGFAPELVAGSDAAAGDELGESGNVEAGVEGLFPDNSETPAHLRRRSVTRTPL